MTAPARHALRLLVDDQLVEREDRESSARSSGLRGSPEGGGVTPRDDAYCRWLSHFFFAPGHDADDLAQEARVAAWLAPHCPRLAARRRVLDVLKASRCRPQFAVISDEHPASDDLVDHVEARVRLRAVLATEFPPNERRALVRLIRGEPIRRDEKALQVALFRARRRLAAPRRRAEAHRSAAARAPQARDEVRAGGCVTANLNLQSKGGNMSALAAPEFTAEAYQLAIPGMDGYKAEKIAVSFSGGVDLDRTSTEDLDFVNGLTLGREITLTVTATVTKKGFSLAPGKDGEADSAGYGVGLKVHSLEVA